MNRFTDVNSNATSVSSVYNTEPTISSENLLIVTCTAAASFLAFVLCLMTIIIVCRKRKKRCKHLPEPLPSPETLEIGLSDTPNRFRTIASTSFRDIDLQSNSSNGISPNIIISSRTKPKRTKNPDLKNHDHSRKDDDSDDDDDYENNSTAINKCIHEASLMYVQEPTKEEKTRSLNPNSDMRNRATPTLPFPDPPSNHGHGVRRGYLNTSRSLESLDKRTVPKPPPLAPNSNSLYKIPNADVVTAPPTKHLKEKDRGYVNLQQNSLF